MDCTTLKRVILPT